jgi:hypothetical protein
MSSLLVLVTTHQFRPGSYAAVVDAAAAAAAAVDGRSRTRPDDLLLWQQQLTCVRIIHCPKIIQVSIIYYKMSRYFLIYRE